MMNNKPHKIIWLAIPGLLLLTAIGRNSTIDIQLHDTYYVIFTWQVGLLWSLILMIIGWWYWLAKAKELINWMTFTHVLLTIAAGYLMVLVGCFFKALITMGEGGEMFRVTNQLLFFLIIATVVSQVIFLINLALTWRK